MTTIDRLTEQMIIAANRAAAVGRLSAEMELVTVPLSIDIPPRTGPKQPRRADLFPHRPIRVENLIAGLGITYGWRR